jgi:hypothetical protein
MTPSPITWFTVPLVPVHGLHHVLEHRVQEAPGVLGIPVGEQPLDPPEIGEKDGNSAALAGRHSGSRKASASGFWGTQLSPWVR